MILDLGGGMQTFSDNRGTFGTIQSLGGGMRTFQDNRGTSGMIMDLGGGIQTYQFYAPRRGRTFGTLKDPGR
jgi:hypothetical protein